MRTSKALALLMVALVGRDGMDLDVYFCDFMARRQKSVQ